MSVAVLGAPTSRARAAARHVVAYLEGQGASGLEAGGSLSPRQPSLVRDSRPGSYFSDSAERPGRWRGAGTESLGDHVGREALGRVLLGRDPVSGQVLVEAVGSAGRTDRRRRGLPECDPEMQLSLTEAAAVIGVDRAYLWRIARRTATYCSQHRGAVSPPVSPTGAFRPSDPQAMPSTYLQATQVEGSWMVTRAEVERFMAARHQPQVVMGYDVTFSAPKSLSILWATGDRATRQLVEEAFEAGVARGVAYLEREAIWVRRGRGKETAGGMIAASYRHSTNRELEPQLHEHVVIANMATAEDGRVQALDARGLFAHATTAGHLAEAEMQHYCNRRGIAWTDTHRGIANVVGVPDEAIRAMSTRREQILHMTADMGTSTPRARQVAALATRAPKQTGVNPRDLRSQWHQRLEAAGFGPEQLAEATSAAPVREWTIEDSIRLDRHLASSHGVTEKQSIFDRRDVIQAIADQTEGRLNGDQIEAHADRWLSTEAVIPLDTSQPRTVIGREGKVALAPDVVFYTTPTIIALEQSIAAAYQAGHDTGAGTVEPDNVDNAIADWQHSTGHTLGADQAVMVRAMCGSGDRFQAVVGPAGSGKTTALEVAARAWEAAGYTVIGAAVNDTAAEVLERSTGIPSRTVAGLVTRLDTATNPVLDTRTVVIVDEASTLGNRHHARLAHHVQTAGATMRTIGDPNQHGAVEAGGMWTHLARQHPDRIPKLTVNRRQATPEMNDVRLANADYRAGRISQAIQRLEANDRIVSAATSAELLDHLAADWYLDHRHHIANPDTAPSRMITEHHFERRALNARAQALLGADGTLTGPGVRIGEATFHVGDQIISRATNRRLHPADDPRNHVRNGTIGTVTAIEGPKGDESLVVNFADRGAIHVPHPWITHELRPGVIGGITPAYAVTSHAAQGATYQAGRTLATDTSTPEAVYVGLTRGRHDTRIYIIKREGHTADTDPQLPRLADDRCAPEALAERLSRPTTVDLATVADPAIARVLYLTRLPLLTLEDSDNPLAQRAAAIVTERITTAAHINPDPAIAAHLGPRPDQPDLAADWDTAVDATALYEARWNERLVEGSGDLAPLADDSTPRQQLQRRGAIQTMQTVRANWLSSHSTVALAEQRSRTVADARRLPATTERPQQNRRIDTLSHHVAAIDRALQPRIERATANPARYLTDTLGPRSRLNARRWDTAARTTETYRHATLGLDPTHGPADPTATNPSIGNRPHGLALPAWRSANAAIEQATRDAAGELRISR